MADYVEQVHIKAVVDTNNVEGDLKRLFDKPIELKFTADTANLFKSVQSDINKIQQSVSKLDFKGLSANLAKSLQAGTNAGIDDLKASYKKAFNEFYRSLSSEDTSRGILQKHLKAPLNSMEEIQKHIAVIKKDLDSAVSWDSANNFEKAMNKAIGGSGGMKNSVKNLSEFEKILSKITKANKDGTLSLNVSINGLEEALAKMREVQSGATETKEALQNLGTFNLDSSVVAQFTQINTSLTQLLSHLSEMKKALMQISSSIILPSSVRELQLNQTSQKLSSVTQQLESENRRIQEGYAARKQIVYQSVKEIQDLINTPVGKTPGGKDQFSQENRDLARATKNYTSNDASDKKLQKSIALLEQYLLLGGKVSDLNIPGLSETSGIVQAARDHISAQEQVIKPLREQVSLYEEELSVQKQALQVALQKEKAESKVAADAKSTPTRKSKKAITEEEFSKVSDTALDKASNLFNEQGYQSMDLAATQLASGVAKVTANVRTANGEWRKFQATITNTGDLINKQYKAIGSNVNLDNRLKEITGIAEYEDRLKKISAELSSGSIDAKFDRINRIYQPFSQAGITDSDMDAQIRQVRQYMQTLNELNAIYKTSDENHPFSSDNANKMVDTYQKLNLEMKSASVTAKALKQDYGGIVSEQDKITASNNMLKWLDNNSRAAKEYGEAIESLANQMRQVTTVSEKNNLSSQFKAITSEAATRGLTGKSWFTSLKDTFSHVSEIFGSYQAVDMVQDLGRQMLSNVKTVDDTLTDLRMATGIAQNDANNLMETYSQLGNELSALGTDVAVSSTEWIKQGESIESANQAAQDSIVLSKIGGLSSEESTKYLTAALKGYQMDTSQAMEVIDKISTVDLMSATDVGGLAEGMSKVASSADLVGVSMDRLLGYLAVIGETTQADMASVGTALNSVFARMGNIKLARLDDYKNQTGEDLSNVETVLRGEGIALRDSMGQFRDFGEVLDETAAKWDSFDSVSQNAVAQAFAGTHHRNSFVILMENYEKAMEYMDEAEASSGSAMEKFDVYTESLSGKITSLQNAFQSLSTTVVSSDFLKGIVDFGTNAVNIINQLIESLGSLNTIILGFSIYKGAKGSGKTTQESLSII